MNDYKVKIETNNSLKQLTVNSDTNTEALQLVMQDFDYSSISEHDEVLTLTIEVTKL